MASEQSTDVKFEIGHVLFIDIVGYSKLLIDQQSELQRQLNEIVRDTEQFRAAKKSGKLIRLSRGDGIALVFFNTVEAPVRCALEVSKALLDHPELQVRMGFTADRSTESGTLMIAPTWPARGPTWRNA